MAGIRKKIPTGMITTQKFQMKKWPYSPNETELADGTVNFYAHYAPLYTSVDIKKNSNWKYGR